MKKILLMAFVSVAMMAFVSCSDDDEKSNPTPASLQGTSWVCSTSYDNIPAIGSISINAYLQFLSETTCRASIDVQPSMLPFSLPESDFGYTFDGSKVQIATDNNTFGTLTLTYTGGTLVYALPSQYAAMLPESTLVFTRR